MENNQKVICCMLSGRRCSGEKELRQGRRDRVLGARTASLGRRHLSREGRTQKGDTQMPALGEMLQESTELHGGSLAGGEMQEFQWAGPREPRWKLQQQDKDDDKIMMTETTTCRVSGGVSLHGGGRWFCFLGLHL